jgi:hypothetical protein
MNCYFSLRECKASHNNGEIQAAILINNMFGLPLSTTIVAFGIPLLLTAGLFWWGLRFPQKDEERHGKPEDPDL